MKEVNIGKQVGRGGTWEHDTRRIDSITIGHCGERLRGQTEHCILGVRGSPLLTLTNESTLLLAPKGKHSEKPDAFYALVESLCPAPRYVEFF